MKTFLLNFDSFVRLFWTQRRKLVLIHNNVFRQYSYPYLKVYSLANPSGAPAGSTKPITSLLFISRSDADRRAGLKHSNSNEQDQKHTFIISCRATKRNGF